MGKICEQKDGIVKQYEKMIIVADNQGNST